MFLRGGRCEKKKTVVQLTFIVFITKNNCLWEKNWNCKWKIHWGDSLWLKCYFNNGLVCFFFGGGGKVKNHYILGGAASSSVLMTNQWKHSHQQLNIGDELVIRLWSAGLCCGAGHRGTTQKQTRESQTPNKLITSPYFQNLLT